MDSAGSSTHKGDSKPIKFQATDFNESEGWLSPDGHWIAYVSDESGHEEVYVRPFPSGPRKVKVSGNRGVQPRWRRDGKELYDMEGTTRYRWMAVSTRVEPGGVFEEGEPTALFGFNGVFTRPTGYDSSYSAGIVGQRFLVNSRSPDDPSLNVITNWEKVAKSASTEP